MKLHLKKLLIVIAVFLLQNMFLLSFFSPPHPPKFPLHLILFLSVTNYF